MSIRSVLKAFFETGDVPTQAQYADLIDSNLNLDDPADQDIKSNVNFKGQATVSGVTISFTATPTFDFDTKPGGNVLKMEVTSNVTTLTIANELPSGSYRVYLTEDGTGGHTLPTPDSSWGEEMDNSAPFKTGADAINLIDIAVDPDGNKLFSVNTK